MLRINILYDIVHRPVGNGCTYKLSPVRGDDWFEIPLGYHGANISISELVQGATAPYIFEISPSKHITRLWEQHWGVFKIIDHKVELIAIHYWQHRAYIVRGMTLTEMAYDYAIQDIKNWVEKE